MSLFRSVFNTGGGWTDRWSTVQVQVMVEDSKLILHREGNYCWLEGFHDPCYGEDKILKLRYLFNEEVLPSLCCWLS